MKLSLTLTVLLLSFIAFAPAVKGQTCTCQSPDNSCEPVVKCKNGCTAICASNDKCFATCSGGPQVDKSVVRVTFKIEAKNSNEVSEILSKHSGRAIVFKPRNDNGPYKFEIIDDHYWEALRYFQQFGPVLVDGTPFYKMQEIRRKLAAGEKVDMDIKDRLVQGVVDDLSLWSGKSFFVSAKPKSGQRFSLALKNVTLAELVERISAEIGVKIEEQK